MWDRRLDARACERPGRPHHSVDFLPFLERLEATARDNGVADRIDTLAASMDELDFADGSLDVIWSEGAIYNIGRAGVRSWRRFLKPGGVIAVSEITWLTDERPAELDEHWSAEYPEVATASAKLGVLEAAGYTPSATSRCPNRVGSITTTDRCRPGSLRSSKAIRTPMRPTACRSANRHEIDLYERHSHHVSYGFYIALRNHA
ncbi:MAG: class I SAM-dependent methyltransferase [Ilumatobacteraceae bacterium]